MTLTLVVGYASKDIGFLIADTLLTPEFALKGDEGPVNGKFHALKIQILNPDTAIAFSGDSATAFAIINRTGVLLNSAPESDVCTLLTEAQKEFGETQDCEFLVLRIAQDGKKLAHITNAGVLHCERAYIGDPAAYRTLMELTRPPTIPQTEIIQQPDGSFISRPYASNAGEIEFQRLSDAMELITNSNRRNTVGAIAGCVIRVADARRSKRLEYLQTVEGQIPPLRGSRVSRF